MTHIRNIQIFLNCYWIRIEWGFQLSHPHPAYLKRWSLRPGVARAESTQKTEWMRMNERQENFFAGQSNSYGMARAQKSAIYILYATLRSYRWIGCLSAISQSCLPEACTKSFLIRKIWSRHSIICILLFVRYVSFILQCPRIPELWENYVGELHTPFSCPISSELYNQ